MKKIIPLIILLFFVINLTGYSQLSDRVNSPSTFKVGTRPLQGNMGLYFGLAYNEIEYWFDHDLDYTGLPIVSLKYYMTDNDVIRIGIQTSKTKEKIKGTVDPLVDGSSLTEKNYVDKESRFLFSPGIEHHFTSSNILDVYVGALLPFGWKGEEYVNDESYTLGSYSHYTRSLFSFTYGYEVFVGIQSFVADLPLAIGLDFGVAGMGHLGTQYKHVVENRSGTITTKQTFYTTDADALGVKYKDMSSSDSKFQGNVRLTIAYFFKK
ncbi:MAG: hypothetical protein MUC93_10600 [Bacteroidales bacterium]|jgi:hypothetical protein|nr:hypothetical protein [Bacteroidales bacterium]